MPSPGRSNARCSETLRLEAGEEIPVLFECGNETLLGILHRPQRLSAVGVLIIVGGPQYRVGSHRQFVHLARRLAKGGFATMRFDYRGMGDSSGATHTFEEVAHDIRRAIDSFLACAPGVHRIVLWGLCDGASAACLYAESDSRVCGLALLNPWVRTESGEAATYLRHYYTKRLLERQFWGKLIRGGIDPVASLCSLARFARRFIGRARGGDAIPQEAVSRSAEVLPERMARALHRFDGSILIVLSGNDLTAREFEHTAEKSSLWRPALDAKNVSWHRLAAADHTLSRKEWKEEVASMTEGWIKSLR